MKHLERAFTDKNIFVSFILCAATILIVLLAAQFISTLIIIPILISNLSSPKDLIGLDMMLALKSIDRNIVLTFIMTPMAFSLLLILILIKTLHQRTFSEVVNGTKQVRWQRVYYGFAIWFAIIAATTIIQYIIVPESFILQFNLKRFIPLLLISLFLIPLQTTFEEVMTRGYLAQGIGSLTGSRWIAFLVPALFFTVLHLLNPEIKEHGFGVMFITYLSMSLIWGLVCILDDGIELAIGMHAANNIFISLFTTQKGAAFETDAVFEVVKINSYIDLAILLACGLITIAIFYKKYNWSFSTLNIKVEKPGATITPVN